MTRTKKLESFLKELQNADLDMILFRNKLVREIQDVENDLKEAYNNILVLMGDRSSMKDQFCIFKMKIKKIKGFVKTFQDDIQAYYKLYLRRDIMCAKLKNDYEEAKEEVNQLKLEVGKIKVVIYENIQGSFDEKMAENIQLRRDVIEFKTESENNKKIINDLTVESGKLNANTKKLTMQLKQGQDSLNKLAQNTKVMEQEIKDQTSYIDKLRSNNENLLAENSQLKGMHDNFTKESSQLWEQNKQLKSQLNETRGIIEELTNEVQIQKEHIDGLIPENDKLHHIVDELKREIEQSNENNRKIISDQDVAKAQQNIKFQSAIDETNRLKTEITKVKMDNERLRVLYKQIIGRN